MRVKVTPQLLERLAACRITTAAQGERWREGNILHINPYGNIEGYCQFLVGPTVPRAFGAFSYSWSECDLALSVGRYCSISLGVQLMGSPHPSSWASSSPFSYDSIPRRPFDEYLADVGDKSAPLLAYDEGVRWAQIGNDVWIGAQAMIKRGVNIGNGAVIGARSIVTHDVPPYAVVAGAPARIIRYRFEEPLIERFMRLEWWRYGPDILQPLDVSAPAQFLDRLEERIAAGLTPAQLPMLTGREIIAAGEPL